MTREEALAEARRVVDSLPEHFSAVQLAKALLEMHQDLMTLNGFVKTGRGFVAVFAKDDLAAAQWVKDADVELAKEPRRVQR